MFTSRERRLIPGGAPTVGWNARPPGGPWVAPSHPRVHGGPESRTHASQNPRGRPGPHRRRPAPGPRRSPDGAVHDGRPDARRRALRLLHGTDGGGAFALRRGCLRIDGLRLRAPRRHRLRAAQRRFSFRALGPLPGRGNAPRGCAHDPTAILAASVACRVAARGRRHRLPPRPLLLDHLIRPRSTPSSMR
jgi:hypothetical protein